MPRLRHQGSAAPRCRRSCSPTERSAGTSSASSGRVSWRSRRRSPGALQAPLVVEEVAHGLLVDHALQQMKLAYEIAEPGVQCRRQAGLRAREEDLDGFARVRVAWPTRV